MDVIEKLVAANTALARALGEPLEPDTRSEDPVPQHLIPATLTAEEVARLEAIVGFPLPPLLRALVSTKNAMPTRSVFGVGEWASNTILEKNETFAAVRGEYDWEVPRLAAITHDEDFLAVTEDGQVVSFCNNEGAIEREHGPLEGFLTRVAAALQQRALDPDGEQPDEDPEVKYV